jgi:hypothetical protein|tara:strand:- start:10563 stop:10895 length:333 start_codon:yes stop_codon:yes gene_type:complete
MPTVFKNAVINNVGTEPVDVLQIPEGVRATVVGCNLANTSDYDTVVVNVYVIDENSTQGNYVRSVPIPPASSAKVVTQGERLILPATAGLRIESDTEDSVDVVISYVEIS